MSAETSLPDRARNALQSNPDMPALHGADGWYDWGWVRDTAANIIDLLASCDIPLDRPIGLVARNRPTVAAALLALLASGRSIRMMYAFQSARMLAAEVARGEIGALVASDDDFSATVIEAAVQSAIPAISVHEEAGVGLAIEPDGWQASVPAAQAAQDGGDLYVEVLTSGTTGPPKHFRLSHDMILHGLLGMNLTYPDDPEDRASKISFAFYPLGTISGLYSYLPPVLNGTPVLLNEKFDLDRWLEHVATYRPRRSSLPPPAIEQMLSREIPREALASIHVIGTGAAPIDAELQRAFEERYHIPLLVSYGATEFGGPVAAMSAELWNEWGPRKRGSAGRGWAGAQLRIVNAVTGEPLPPGQEGLLEVISPAMGSHWIRTTDLAVIDQDDFLFHRGRADGAITRGGFSILPEVIEQALSTHPKVASASVVGLPHRRLGETPVAAIQPKNFADPPDIDELERHIRDHVYATHVPTQFRIVKQLPLNQSLKVDLPRVRALFEKKPGS